MPWVSLTTTSLSARIAAATAPAAVSALTLSFSPVSASMPMVLMTGIASAWTSSWSMRRLTSVTCPTWPRSWPSSVLTRVGVEHVGAQAGQAHRLAPLAADEVDDERVDLAAEHLLGDAEGGIVRVASALDEPRHDVRLTHGGVDRLAAAVDDDRLHADVVHEDDVRQQSAQCLLVVHDAPADLDDDDLVVEPLDVAQCFEQHRRLAAAATSGSRRSACVDKSEG